MSSNSFNVWERLLPLCLPRALTGYSALGVPPFPFEQCPCPTVTLNVVMENPRAAWPSPSLMVLCFWYSDSWGIVTSLLTLSYLITMFMAVNTLNEISFSWNMTHCGFCSSRISDSAVLDHSVLFCSIFLVSLYLGHQLPSCWILFALILLSFYLCSLELSRLFLFANNLISYQCSSWWF